MKITNWCRKLAASLIAAGLMVPTASAANLDTNLVVNGTFENVSYANTGAYNAPDILDWGGTVGGAYSHTAEMGTADYANGGLYTTGTPFSGGGNYYFTPGNRGNQSHADAISQEIDVSAGQTAAAIGAGEAAYNLSAIFNSFSSQTDHGVIDLEFLDSGASVIGTGQLNPGSVNFSEWTALSSSGFVPANTAKVRVSAWGVLEVGGSSDGYMDNIDFQITSAENVLLFLEVNTTTGVAKLRNNTGEAAHIDYYEIMSDNGHGDSLSVAGWNSLQDQNLAGFPAGNGSGNGWEEAGGIDSDTLSESFLTGNSQVPNQASVDLGALFNTGAPQNLTFRYGLVNSDGPVDSDFDGDSDVDGNDFLAWQRGFPGTYDSSDLVNWQNDFGGTGAASGPGVLTTGFVRYVSDASTSAIPEPASILLVGIGLAATFSRRGRA